MRFREIDDSNRRDHFNLTATDKCFFLYEYTAGVGYGYSDTNSLISNLKKKPSERLTKGGWAYKGKAIERCASELGEAFNHDWLRAATLVPAPSSKSSEHPDYDDRLVRVLGQIPIDAALDIRQLIRTKASRPAAHESDVRPSVEDLLGSYDFDAQAASARPVAHIGIFDDLLTVGTTFRAMKHLLAHYFPGVPITGIFVARRAIQNPFGEIDLSAIDL